MVDAALIKQCADPSLTPAIVERFIERGGAQDPLAISVRSGNRVVLVPRPTTVDEAMELIRQHVGRAVVRVGLTQYPAGLGLVEARELKPDLVNPCANRACRKVFRRAQSCRNGLHFHALLTF